MQKRYKRSARSMSRRKYAAVVAVLTQIMKTTGSERVRMTAALRLVDLLQTQDAAEERAEIRRDQRERAGGTGALVSATDIIQIERVPSDAEREALEFLKDLETSDDV